MASRAATPVQQTQSDSRRRPLQQAPDGGAGREAETGLVQMLCSECESGQAQMMSAATEEAPLQMEAADASPVQQLCSGCEGESELQHGGDSAGPSPVQMWDCGDYSAPTCGVQASGDLEPVQPRCAACEGGENTQRRDVPGEEAQHRRRLSPRAVQRIARAGVAGANEPLPHLQRIQAAFGRHDLSGVRTATGGSAASASADIGARAYTIGERIAFRHPPSLHLAAHEAAHTVQQRGGLRLPGNVGRPGDRWERHADRVADAVVAGESAEPLLNEVADPARDNPGGDGTAVQRRLSVDAFRITEGPAGGGEGGAEAGKESDASGEKGGGSEQGQAAGEGQAEGVAEAAESGAESTPEENSEKQQPEPACNKARADEAGEGDAAEGEGDNAGAGGEAEEAPPDATPGPGECFTDSSPEPPEDTEEPDSDSPPNDVKEESDVTFPEWEEPDDACDCEVAEAQQQNAGQVPAEVAPAGPHGGAVAGAEEAPADGAGAVAEEGRGESAAEPGAAVGPQPGGGAAAGGGEGGAAAGPDFSAGEAGRDAAVADYQRASEELPAIPARAARLSRGLSFANARRGSAAEEVRRNVALTQIGAFFAGAAGQLSDAVAFVTQDVPERLGGMADAAKVAIDESMAAERAAISGRMAAARAAARGQAAAARARIRAQFQVDTALVNVSTDTAIAALKAAHQQSSRAISRREDTSLAEVNSRFARSRRDHNAKGEESGQQAIARGQHFVDQYEGCKVVDGERYGDDGFWDGCLTVRRAHAQQEAACKTASGFYKNMTRLAQEKGYNLREQRTQYRCAVISGAGQFSATLDNTLEQLIGGLEKGRKGSLDGLKQVRDMNLQAVDAALAASIESLHQRERAQRQAVNDAGYIQQLAAEQMAHGATAGLARAVAAATASLELLLADLREKLTAGEAPPPEQLAQLLANAQAGIGGGMGSLLEKMEEGASGAELRLADLSFGAADSLAAITRANAASAAESEAAFAAQMTALTTAAIGAMDRLAQQQVAKAAESSAQGTASMAQMVSGFESATEQIYTQVDEATARSMSDLETDLENMAGRLDGQIAREANKAASKEQPAWKGVVAIVLIILVIIASVVVSVLTLGAGAPFLAVVLVGAVVGAITAGLIQVINNWAAGEDLGEGVVQAMVIGAVGGALGGAIGAGANGLAQAAVQGLRAGASSATQMAVNIGINLAGDMVSEGLSQTFAYVAFGQSFNWQGFVMAGGMSVASTARGGLPGSPRTGAPDAPAGVPRGAGADAPSAPPRTGGASADIPPSAGARARGALLDVGIGLGVAGAVEGLSYASGGEADFNRFVSSAASGAAGARAAGRGNRGGAGADSGGSTPRVRTGPDAAAPRPQGGDPASTPTSGSGGRLSRTRERLQGAGRRLGEMRDAAFSRLEISDSNRLNQRVRGGFEAVENWFAGRGRPADAEPGSPRSGGGDGDSGRVRLEADENLSQPRNPDADLVVPGASRRIDLGGSEHTVAAKRAENGDVIIAMCSGCSRMSMTLRALAGQMPKGGPTRPRLHKLARQVEALEAKIRNGEIPESEIPSRVAEMAEQIRAVADSYPSTVRRALAEEDFDPEVIAAREEARIDNEAAFDRVEEHLGEPVPPLPDALADDYVIDSNGVVRRKSPKESRVQLTNRDGYLEVAAGRVDRTPTLDAEVKRSGLSRSEAAELERLRDTPRSRRSEADNERIRELRNKSEAVDLNKRVGADLGEVEPLATPLSNNQRRRIEADIRQLEQKTHNQRTAKQNERLSELRAKLAGDALRQRLDQNISQGQRNKGSEALGELAADEFIGRAFPSARKAFQGEGAGQLDAIYRNGSPPPRFIIAEAKGGSATNTSTRQVAGERLQQGRSDYLLDVLNDPRSVHNMPADLRRQLIQVIRNNEIRYLEVSQKVTNEGNLGSIKTREYIL